MMSLRQRLLLVAGWFIAAVGAGLVASGAVAVAGGQVLDRPLRPMTAAGVAALPVVEVGSPDALEPHASGGLVSTTGGPTSGSDDVAEGPDGPAGAGGSTAPVPGSPPAPPLDETDPLIDRGDRVFRIVSGDGGQASFAIADDALVLLWVTPQSGYVASMRDQTEDSITISFSSGLGFWLVEANVVDGEIIVTQGPGPLG